MQVFGTPVEITIDGCSYMGTYIVGHGQTVTVHCGRTSKSAPLTELAPSVETIARLLLAEIVADAMSA